MNFSLTNYVGNDKYIMTVLFENTWRNIKHLSNSFRQLKFSASFYHRFSHHTNRILLIEFFPNKAQCYQKIPSKKWLKYYQRILYVWCLKCYWWITSRKTFNPICPGVFLSDHAPGGGGGNPPPAYILIGKCFWHEIWHSHTLQCYKKIGRKKISKLQL